MVRFRYKSDHFRDGASLYLLWPSDKTVPRPNSVGCYRVDPIISYRGDTVAVQHYQVFSAEIAEPFEYKWEKDWQIDLEDQFEVSFGLWEKGRIIDILTQHGIGRGLMIVDTTFDPEGDI